MFFRKIIIAGMNLLALFPGVSKKTSDAHFMQNRSAWKKYYLREVSRQTEYPYITKQADLTFLYYGRERRIWRKLIAGGQPITAAFNCCEVIAVMNTLIAAGIKKDAADFPALLRRFERKGLILSGYFGTSPRAVLNFLRNRGLRVTKLPIYGTVSNGGFSSGRLVDITSQAYIFIAQNGKSLFSEVHTMCIIKNHEGYIILNDFEGNKTYPSLRAAIAGYRSGDSAALALYEVRHEI